MSRLELVAGNYGTGRADWINFEFRLPKKQVLPIEAVVSVEENGDYIEKTFLSSLKSGASGAVGLGATAAVVGIFAAPLAAVGAIGLTAAAIGGGLGVFGGGIERKILLQVMGADGRGFVAICEIEMAADIRKAISVAHSLRMRAVNAAAENLSKSRVLFGQQKHVRTPVEEKEALPIRENAPALVAPEVVEMRPDADGVFQVAGKAISSSAEAAGTIASDAYAATSEAVEGAWTAVVSRLPWGGTSKA
ncbi:hypothetical protein PUR23_26660 [Methylorubrum populi]|uniref:hypothetical protein n=1 Tax=Methylorubrum populi TaxID=223967 RepID=UPI0031F862E7